MRLKSLKWLIPLGCGLLTLVLFHTVFLLAYIPTSSMEPTIRSGSIVLGIRCDGHLKDLNRGDIVFFRHDGQLLVKRIAAMAGDTVRLDGAEVVVPDGCIYVLGDNQASSVDSADWTEPFVPINDVIGVCANNGADNANS